MPIHKSVPDALFTSKPCQADHSRPGTDSMCAIATVETITAESANDFTTPFVQ
jgi:hypothetical protein